MNKYPVTVTCPPNTEDLLKQELESIGATEIKLHNRRIDITATLEISYRICLESRIANKVLIPLGEVNTKNKETLYETASKIDWENQFDIDKTFAIDCGSTNESFRHTHFPSLVVKDAIVDKFQRLYGKRPNIESTNPDIKFLLFFNRNDGILYIDLSGEPLQRRGYRDSKHKAPIKENLAAAILLRSNWQHLAKEGLTLFDPMCGSGTLLIEGALIAGEIPPGIFRDYFGFFGWKNHDKDLFENIKNSLKVKHKEGLDKVTTIVGMDNDNFALSQVRESAKKIGINNKLILKKQDLLNFKMINELKIPKGLLVVNPPYGERLGEEEEVVELHKALGSILRDNFKGWNAGIISSNINLLKATGLKANRKHTLYNGPLKCTLAGFNIFTDSEKDRVVSEIVSKELPLGAQMFKNRILKKKKQFRKWLKRENISCYRIYDRDMPEYNVSIDFYENSWAFIQEFAPPKTIDPKKAQERLKHVIKALPEALEIDKKNIFYRQRKQQKGSNQYEKLSTKGEKYIINEGPGKFFINLTDYLDTGIFLDHRLTRKKIFELANGKSFLNLFAYTGSVSVYAALGGASSVTTLDNSNTYLNWAKDNFKINKIDLSKTHFIKDECFKWLKNCKEKYDLIFLDPPTFSNSKNSIKTFDIQSDQTELIKLTMKCLTLNGTLIFSTNFKKFKLDLQLEKKYIFKEISEDTIPIDFSRKPFIHRCWEVKRKIAKVITKK